MTQNNLYMENDDLKLYVDVQPLSLDVLESSKTAALECANLAQEYASNARALLSSITDYKTNIESFYNQSLNNLSDWVNSAISDLNTAKNEILCNLQNMHNSAMIEINSTLDRGVSLDKLNQSKVLKTGSISTDIDAFSWIKKLVRSTYDSTKFTAEGSPIITSNGVASGFSSSNYLKTIKVGTLNSNNFKIKIPFNLTNASQQGVLISSKLAGSAECGLAALVNNSKVLAYFSSNGTSWDIGSGGGTTTLQSNTDYLLEISFTGSQYLVELTNLSTGTKTTELTINSTAKIYNGNNLLCLGYQGWNALAYGSIDLKDFSITVDGVPVFSGNKTGIDTIKQDDYTVVGSPTITDDGVASGFASQKYISKTVDTTFSNTTNFIYESPIFKLSSFSAQEDQLITYYSNNDASLGFITLGVTLAGKLKGIIKTSSDIIRDTSIQLSLNIPYQARFICENGVLSFQYKQVYSSEWITITTSSTSFSFTANKILIGSNTYSGILSAGSVDLNALKIYTNGDLTYQPCLKIPYTESKTGSKIVNAIYRDRINDVYDEFGYAPYFSLDEEGSYTDQQLPNFTLPMGEMYGMMENIKKMISSST